jgi:general secretion pathway protein I
MRPRRHEAFTLIEVLVALSVLAVALVTLLGLEVASIRLSDTAQRLTRASLIAADRMAQVTASRDYTPRRESGTVQDVHREIAWDWETTVAEAAPAELEAVGVKDLRSVTVRVRWDEGRRSREFLLATFVAVEKKP